MTAQEAAYACLEYIGDVSLSETAGLLGSGYSAAGVRRAIVRAINRALMDLFRFSPNLFRREIGLLLPAPQQGTVTVTHGATQVSGTSLTGTPFAGQAIRIDGQTEWTTLVTVVNDSNYLGMPYSGTTGTRNATLYGDVIAMPEGVSAPLGPVWLADIRELAPLASKSEFIGYDPNQSLNSDWGRVPSGVQRLPRGRTIGQPEVFFVETVIGADGSSSVRMSVSPVPDTVYFVRFDAHVNPPGVTDGHLGTEGDDPGFEFPLPPQFDVMFLLPVILYHFSGCAFFKNADALRQISANYAAILPQIEAWSPHSPTGNAIVSTGWRRRPCKL